MSLRRNHRVSEEEFRSRGVRYHQNLAKEKNRQENKLAEMNRSVESRLRAIGGLFLRGPDALQNAMDILQRPSLYKSLVGIEAIKKLQSIEQRIRTAISVSMNGHGKLNGVSKLFHDNNARN